MKNSKKHFPGKLFFSFILIFGSLNAFGQGPQVPREIQFADLTIKINEQARREIQLDVDALHRNQNYFKAKADRANLYMPLIERELRELGVPVDLKYLAIQESSLIPDAVSSSNAVGFWQFKQGTAEEVNLRVDNQVDERKNIVSSTRGAAMYLKKHNAQFDNWMCAVVAYQMGLGGARAYFGSQFNGKKVIEIDRNSHWYFKKFLAHKIAFENQVGASFVSNNGYLEELKVQGPSNLKTIATRVGVSESHLLEYNKWAVNGNIPGDKSYSVVYVKQGTPPVRSATSPREVNLTASQQPQLATLGFPRISGNEQNAGNPNQILVNNIEGIRATANTSQKNFAKQLGISPGKLRRLNDMQKDAPIVAGQYYYLDKKAPKAEVSNHVVMPGETLWSISHKYGIRLAALKTKNRIRTDQDLTPGMVLNLQDQRRRSEEIVMVSGSEYRKMLEEISTPQSTETARSTTPAPTTRQPAVQPTTIPAQEQRQEVPKVTEPIKEEIKTPEPKKEEPVKAEIPPSIPEPSTPRVEENRTAAPKESSPVTTPSAPTVTASSSNRVHIVAPGETLFRLSQNYSVSVDDLKRWNNLPDNTIKVGQEIIVSPTSSSPAPNRPSSTTEQTGTIIHTVVQGETLFRLSQNYGVSVDDIKRWNNLSDNNITVGQKISIIKP